MAITAKHDPEARAMYVRLADGRIASSVEIDEDFVVDLDADSTPLGVELLTLPVSKAELEEVALRFGFLDRFDRIWAEIQRVHPPQPTRSAVFASYTFALTYQLGPGPYAVGASSSRIAVDAHEYALIA